MMKRIVQFQVVTEDTDGGQKRRIFALDTDGGLFSALLDLKQPAAPQWTAMKLQEPESD